MKTLFFLLMPLFLFSQSIMFLGVDNNEEACISTWTYEICKYDDPKISHVVFGLCNNLCINSLQITTIGDFFEIEWGNDPRTSLCGLKFGDPYNEDFDCEVISYTIDGIYNTSYIDVAFKSGQEIEYRLVEGPNPYQDCGDVCELLPVILTEFYVVYDENNAHELHWSVFDETNFSHFELEHSRDGILWNLIGTINNKGGANSYNYFCIPEYGENYYRLKMVDINGEYSYSNITQLRGLVKPMELKDVTIYEMDGKLITYSSIYKTGIYYIYYRGSTKKVYIIK